MSLIVPCRHGTTPVGQTLLGISPFASTSIRRGTRTMRSSGPQPAVAGRLGKVTVFEFPDVRTILESRGLLTVGVWIRANSADEVHGVRSGGYGP